MKWLKQVAKYHDDYLRIVRSLGEDVYAEDIVQEMYLRLHKYGDLSRILQKDGKVNINYIRCVLYNIYKTLYMARQKHQKVDLNEAKHLTVEYDYISKKEGEYLLEAKLNEEMRTWHWYDEMLFKYYRDNEWSFRKASRETRIGTKSIFTTIKYCKDRLRENCAEDYEDYINEDYEKI